MTIQHHPHEETLLSYAAGSLSAAMALVVGSHVQLCAECRRRLVIAEGIGGQLLETLPPQPLPGSARAAVLQRLDEALPVAPARPQPPMRPAKIPSLLRRLLPADDYRKLPWRTMAPGIRQLNLDCDEDKLFMLWVGAGKRMPVHTHRGTELTLILDGGYRDKLGEFHVGDFADLDGSTEHQPIAFEDEDCICLASLDERLRFRSWLPRLFQPFTGL